MDIPKHLIEEEEGIDLRKWFFRILENWALFLFFIFLSIGFAVIYNITAEKRYELSTSVLIKENTNPLDKANLVKVSLYSDPYRLENEIGIINSSSVKKGTLRSLDFFVEYFHEQALQSVELYSNSPFLINFDSIHSQPVNVQFNVKYLTDSLLYIYADGEDVVLYNFKLFQNEGFLSSFQFSDTVRIGDTVRNVNMKFSITVNFPGLISDYKKNDYSFYFRPMSFLLRKYGDVQVNIPNESSIIHLTPPFERLSREEKFSNFFPSNRETPFAVPSQI